LTATDAEETKAMQTRYMRTKFKFIRGTKDSQESFEIDSETGTTFGQQMLLKRK
jgi:hypothetical protein